MALRTPYCLPVDVLRKFDPTLSQSDLSNDKMFGNDDLEKWRAEVADACDEFDQQTDNAHRLTHVGRGDSWEYHDAELRKHQGGVKVFLDHMNVLPFDYAEGDRVQIRTTRQNWRDITESTDRYRLNAPDGILQIFTRRVSIAGRNRRAMISDNIRVKYRYGALGGTRDRAGQTNLASGVVAGDSTIDVDNVDRLPRSGLVLIGSDGTNDPEYIRFNGVDETNDQLQNVSRGARGTSDTAHESGTEVHYCPMDIRKAVAGRVAMEFVRSDDIAGNLSTPDDNVSHSDRIDDWKEDWQNALGKYSEAYML